MMQRAGYYLTVLTWLGISGCSCSTNVGLNDNDAMVERDAAVEPRTDECGNGIDDDDNGRIDDGCPCGVGETQSCFVGALVNRGVGACFDGVQTCQLGGVEWGDWGDAPCLGGATPAVEQCDGMDHDCDGARDEDCPCTAGTTQDCGLEFVTAPCRAGTQTCRASGIWSGCEGAVGPMSDVCDGVDNDCDGEPDEGCECVPEPERCRDGVDNDCDGTIDEPACTPDWPPADAGVPVDASGTDAGLPPPEGCTSFPDFRDRITWERAIPGAGHFIPNIGSPGQSAWLGGPGADTVTVDLRAEYGGSPYTFGASSSTAGAFGRMAFRDGAILSFAPVVGSHDEADVTGTHIAKGGRLMGTVDFGPGPWTSDPTLYTTRAAPVAVPDLYWAAGPERSSTFTDGGHYARGGVPPDPMPGSFQPWLQIGLAKTDALGDTYIGGTFEGVFDFGGGVSGASTSARPVTPGWARFTASFGPSGAARWLRVWAAEQNGAGAVDPTGRYLLTTGYISASPQRAVVELVDASTGATLFRHAASANSFVVVAYDVDGDGNVYVSGRTLGTATTLGALSVPANRAVVASFDRTGALRWSHQMFDSTFPAVLSTKHLVSVGAGEVAVLVGLLPQFAPIDVDIAGCRATIEKRWYPRSPETGVATSTQPASYWEVKELLIAVLDSRSGALRWSRRVDSITMNNVSMEMHPSGDLLFAMHNEPSMAKVDYGTGLTSNATHVFRLRGR